MCFFHSKSQFIEARLGFSTLPMAATHKKLQAPLHIRSQQQTYSPQSHTPSSQASFPILAIAIIGILATALLLLGYYIFAIKCCLNTRPFNILSPFSISRSRRRQLPYIIYASSNENRGLDESDIRAIPTLQFKELEFEQRDLFECAVCLNEFQEEEKLRILPRCTHVFHIDCIDIWLQNNDNCPLCRSSISISATQPPATENVSPTSSVIAGDQDFVVIEVRNEDSVEEPTAEDVTNQPINPSPRKPDKKVVDKKERKFHHVSSMGDECINVRATDDQFSVQPIRRSISMDSSADRLLFLSVQGIIQQNRHLNEESTSEDCSSSSSSTSTKLRRSFFSLKHGRGSRNAVLPIDFS